MYCDGSYPTINTLPNKPFKMTIHEYHVLRARTSVDEASRIDCPFPHRSITPRRMPQNSAAPARPEYTYLEEGGGWRRVEEDGRRGTRVEMEEGRGRQGDPWVLAFKGLGSVHIFEYNTARRSQALAPSLSLSLSPSPSLSSLFSSLSLILSLPSSPARTVSTDIDPASGCPPASPFPTASPRGAAPRRGPGSGWMSSIRTPCRASPLAQFTMYRVYRFYCRAPCCRVPCTIVVSEGASE